MTNTATVKAAAMEVMSHDFESERTHDEEAGDELVRELGLHLALAILGMCGDLEKAETQAKDLGRANVHLTCALAEARERIAKLEEALIATGTTLRDLQEDWPEEDLFEPVSKTLARVGALIPGWAET